MCHYFSRKFVFDRLFGNIFLIHYVTVKYELQLHLLVDKHLKNRQ